MSVSALAGGLVGIPAIASHPWAYPALEVVHLVGMALLLGNLVALELRVWGAACALPLPALGRLSITLALTGFALLGASGVLMFAAAPGDMLANRSFLIKMGLIHLAGLNAAWFHARGGLARPDATARALTALSLGLWLAVVALGRWIAYT
jgi:hypothetical protein